MLRSVLLHVGRLCLLVLVAVAMQAVLSVRLPLLGVSPDVFTVVLVLVAISEGSLRGAVFGLVVGLVADIVFLEPMGLRSLIYVAVGYACGRFGEEVGVESAWVVVALVGLATFVAQAVYAVFMFLVAPEDASLFVVRAQILPATLVNALLAAPVYLGLMRVRLLPHPAEGEPSFR